jgi:hypothetical protein
MLYFYVALQRVWLDKWHLTGGPVDFNDMQRGLMPHAVSTQRNRALELRKCLHDLIASRLGVSNDNGTALLLVVLARVNRCLVADPLMTSATSTSTDTNVQQASPSQSLAAAEFKHDNIQDHVRPVYDAATKPIIGATIVPELDLFSVGDWDGINNEPQPYRFPR